MCEPSVSLSKSEIYNLSDTWSSYKTRTFHIILWVCSESCVMSLYEKDLLEGNVVKLKCVESKSVGCISNTS